MGPYPFNIYDVAMKTTNFDYSDDSVWDPTDRHVDSSLKRLTASDHVQRLRELGLTKLEKHNQGRIFDEVYIHLAFSDKRKKFNRFELAGIFKNYHDFEMMFLLYLGDMKRLYEIYRTIHPSYYRAFRHWRNHGEGLES